jgi:hypothetical protein
MISGFAAVAFMACSLYAQGFKIAVNVPHEFVVDSQSYPPGNYEISQNPNSPNQIRLFNLDTKKDFGFIPILTRLSQTKGEESRIVFDTSGEKRSLSEIHIAGIDGFHLKGAPGAHTHAVVKAK